MQNLATCWRPVLMDSCIKKDVAECHQKYLLRKFLATSGGKSCQSVYIYRTNQASYMTQTPVILPDKKLDFFKNFVIRP